MTNPVGRPSEKTPETVKKLEEAFAMDCDVSEACSYANISRTTYYEWIKEDPILADRFQDLKQRPFLKARNAIVKGLDDPEFALKYMERKKKAEFASRTELTGANGESLGVIKIPAKEINNENTLGSTTETGSSPS